MFKAFSLPAVILLLVAIACATAAPDERPARLAQQDCPVQGAWELVSATVDGEPQVREGWRQLKLVTRTHYTWVGQEPGPTTLQTAADSLAAFATIGFGAGSYRVTPTTYTERLELFSNPEYIGREATFSCRVEGDRWYHEGELPIFEGGRETARVRLAEVWRRLD